MPDAGNRSSRLEAAYDPSGAVHIEGNAEFTMTGGEIKNNVVSGKGKGKGGGVCVVDPGCQGGEKGNTAFTMQGGSISGTSASAGGGVYTYSNDVTLSAGEIKGNTAWSMGGGVYSEGNEYLGYSTLLSKTLSLLITMRINRAAACGSARPESQGLRPGRRPDRQEHGW